MYLTHIEYMSAGGALHEAAFKPLERRAEYLINAQANGQTGKRISKLTELPQAVKDCVFELIEHMSANAFDGTAVKSESQSQGGVNESYTYSRLTKVEADNAAEDIIYTYLSAVMVNGVSILYRGACV